MLKDRTILNSEEITASDEGVLEVSHVRNCEMIEILYGDEVVASLDTETEYVNGVAITESPMSYQIYQRDENDQAAVTIKGTVSDASEVSININGDTERADIEDNEFTYTKVLDAGLYDITVNSDIGEVAAYTQVGVGDIWVGAGQSNMTDMGAVTDGFEPDTDDPINENMHIIYAEDCTWHQMEHPAGEGRFFKSGIRTSPVTSFAREIAESESVPVGIVQSSVGGTNIYQWVEGVRDSDPNVVYGDTSVSYRQAQIDTAKVTGSNEITLTFKDTDGLEIAQGIKRIGITNVSGGDVTESYALEKNNEETPPPEENQIYTFGNSYKEIKPFEVSSLQETPIGDTQLKISTSTSDNYNNVVIRDKSSTNSGYYPYENGLPEKGYYLFIGSGGNRGAVTAKMYLTQ